jgi:hypothetical protein
MFWNKIVIVGQDKCIKEIVAFFIDRTCGEPFSFEFRGHTCDVYPILMDLVVHSEQWETVSIQLRQSQLGYLCGAMGRLPLLKKLNILVEDHGTTGNTIPTMISNIFEDAPRLTHIVVSDAAVRQFKFNWSSLTVVNFQQPKDWQIILAVLRETSNLVELTIKHEFPDHLDGGGGGLIHLPHLECLSVNVVAFLTILKTPSLQQLKIDFHPSESNGLNNVGFIVAFLHRSAIKLSTLVIQNGSAANVKEILPFTPEINKLVLLMVADTTNVFKWLAGTGVQELRCSNLNLLWAYSTTEGGAEGLKALHYMIARRNRLRDVRDPSPREVFNWIPCGAQSTAANLQLLCRGKGIRFASRVDEEMTLPWGVNLYGVWHP